MYFSIFDFVTPLPEKFLGGRHRQIIALGTTTTTEMLQHSPSRIARHARRSITTTVKVPRAKPTAKSHSDVSGAGHLLRVRCSGVRLYAIVVALRSNRLFIQTYRSGGHTRGIQGHAVRVYGAEFARQIGLRSVYRERKNVFFFLKNPF